MKTTKDIKDWFENYNGAGNKETLRPTVTKLINSLGDVRVKDFYLDLGFKVGLVELHLIIKDNLHITLLDNIRNSTTEVIGNYYRDNTLIRSGLVKVEDIGKVIRGE